VKRHKKKKMPAKIRKYLAALKHARLFPDFDKKEHEAIKRHHGV
jgi:hypothetical protein